MAETVSVNEALVDVRQEGDKWRGYITPAWFRYIIASSPAGTGTGTGVLHGNGSGGSPTWGPVDLTSDVTGILPAANGGLGGITGISGGLLYATGASSYSVTAAGTAHQVLHGSATTPSWSAVDLALDTTGQIDLTAQVSGVLPVANGGTGGVLPVLHGGTGTTTSTGTGSVVLSTAPSLFGGQWTSPFVVNGISWTVTAPSHAPQLALASSMDFTINTGPSTFILDDHSLLWCISDMTNGGMALGTMNPTTGVAVISNTMANVTFTRLAGSGLQITITLAPFIRRFLGFAADLGV